MILHSAVKHCANAVNQTIAQPHAIMRLTWLHRRSFHRIPPSLTNSLNPLLKDPDNFQKVEEENFDYYSPDYFYPVRFGDALNSRYQVVSKLGYGASSTVWLCQDLQKRKNHFVAVKVCTLDSFQAKREIEVLKHLNTIRSKHPGSALVRKLLDHFEISGSSGRYPCLVYPALGTPISILREGLPNRRLSEGLLKQVVTQVLIALDFLHTEAGIVYTDLKEDNLIMGIGDKSVLTEYVDAVGKMSAPDKTDGDRIIYRTRDLIAFRQPGPPVLCDFGEARLREHSHTDLIMPYQYRAPEVLLGLEWDSKVDIWSVAMLTWHLFEDKHMFVTVDANGEPSASHHLAHLVALFGPPPLDFLRRGRYSSNFFDEDGHLLSDPNLPASSLEDLEDNLEGSNQQLFLDFMRRIARWHPEDRPCAKDLLRDPWLTTD